MVIVGVTLLLGHALVGASVQRFILTLTSGKPPKHWGTGSVIPQTPDPRTACYLSGLMWSYQQSNWQVNRAGYIKSGVVGDSHTIHASITTTSRDSLFANFTRDSHQRKC